MNTSETFVPVTIGTSPRGVVWTAYKPQNVEPMRRKLAELWKAEKRTVYGLSKAARDEAASIGILDADGHPEFTGFAVRGSVPALRWLLDRVRRYPEAFRPGDAARIVQGIRAGVAR